MNALEAKDIDALRLAVKGYMSEKRYLHTLGVERAALRIGNEILPDRSFELSAAALLHDISKERPIEEHYLLINEYGKELTEEDLTSYPVLHSFSAPELIKRDFPRYASPDILNAVFNHTLGAPYMSCFEEIIYIADYIEDGRTYPSCIEVREYLYERFSALSKTDDKQAALSAAVLMALLRTRDSLIKEGRNVNSRTLETIEHYKNRLNI